MEHNENEQNSQKVKDEMKYKGDMRRDCYHVAIEDSGTGLYNLYPLVYCPAPLLVVSADPTSL